ncbi:MAG: ribonuclease D [Alphaproteobacteria bacterium]|nr:ribonuclease D [Alphaproteobacteria bacterium]
MKYITTTQDLTAFCDSLKGADFVTIDTEFMRERTYYAKLCLVQLGGPKDAAAIDPLAEGIDLQPLYALLDDSKILKVFHAARQDVEIFVNMTGRVPTPIFDTQIAAMVCGYGESIGYEPLASSLTNAVIDKSSRYTDWSQRPLTERQIDYALADVTHLRDIYVKLAAQIEKSSRGEWVNEEMAILTDVHTYQTDPMEVWKRLKLRTDKPRRRAILRELAAWRELEAQSANLPRARVIKDEQLLEIANHAPATIEDLARTRGLSQGFAQGRLGAAILEAITRGNAISLKDCPAGEVKKKMPSGAGAVLELLKVLLRQVSDKYGVAAKLIATSDDLERLAAEDEPDIKPLHGWRRKLFGDTALAFKHGNLALAIKNNKVTTISL